MCHFCRSQGRIAYKFVPSHLLFDGFAALISSSPSFYSVIPAANASETFSFKCHRAEAKLPRTNPPKPTLIYSVNSISFHKTYGTFASAGGDGLIHIWDASARSRLKSTFAVSFLSRPHSSFCSPDFPLRSSPRLASSSLCSSQPNAKSCHQCYSYSHRFNVVQFGSLDSRLGAELRLVERTVSPS